MLISQYFATVCQLVSRLFRRSNRNGHYTFDEYDPETTIEVRLDLGRRGIKTIDPSIGRLYNLEELNLYGNDLITLPDEIGMLKNLWKLMASRNKLESLPESIGNLADLSVLHLNNNNLTGLPKAFEKLTGMKVLSLYGNPLKMFPEPILGLGNLEFLSLCNTGLSSLPDNVGNLTKLSELYLNGNRLTRLPKTMGNLKNLWLLNLEGNPLGAFPEQILAMKKLRTLDLEDTGLCSVPDGIKNLKKLTNLCLKSNQLTSLPKGIFDFANSITWMGLTKNNLPLSLQIRLRREFANRVMLDMGKLKAETAEILKEDVYRDLESRPLHWNFDKLRSLRQKPVPESTLDEWSLKELWEDTIANLISPENQKIIEEFIHHLFHPNEEYNRCKMNEIHIPLAKNLIEAVILKLSKVKNDDEKIISSIDDICEGLLEYCPDRQVGRMMFIYYLLADEVDPTSSIEEFVRYFVAHEKTRVFEIAIIPTASFQNVYVQNFWKYNLRDEVGFDFEFKKKFGTMGWDRYHGLG